MGAGAAPVAVAALLLPPALLLLLVRALLPPGLLFPLTGMDASPAALTDCGCLPDDFVAEREGECTHDVKALRPHAAPASIPPLISRQTRQRCSLFRWLAWGWPQTQAHLWRLMRVATRGCAMPPAAYLCMIDILGTVCDTLLCAGDSAAAAAAAAAASGRGRRLLGWGSDKYDSYPDHESWGHHEGGFHVTSMYASTTAAARSSKAALLFIRSVRHTAFEALPPSLHLPCRNFSIYSTRLCECLPKVWGVKYPACQYRQLCRHGSCC